MQAADIRKDGTQIPVKCQQAGGVADLLPVMIEEAVYLFFCMVLIQACMGLFQDTPVQAEVG